MKRKDSVLFVLYRFFANSAFFVPVIVVFLKYKTHSSATALSIIGVYSLVIMLVEIPTGIITDTSRRHHTRNSVCWQTYMRFSVRLLSDSAIRFSLFCSEKY